MAYIPKPGIGSSANYISSGIPRIINNITVPLSGSGAHTEEFAQVPRKITIKNTLSSDSASVPVLVGFFENCFDTNEVLELDNQQSLTGLYRPKNIYMMSSDGTSEASASILLESTGINFPTSDFQWFQSESANTRGVGNASSYQISGIPQVFGKRLIEETVGYDFHHISRDVTIYNNIPITEDSAPIRVGFNSASMEEADGNWFVLENGESYTGEWKLNSIWLRPHTETACSASIVVGLTGIKADLDFNNYSGSTVVASRKTSTLPRFTNYDALYSYLEDQGSSYLRAVPLYSIGSDGDDTNIIGHWSYQSGSSGYVISPMGMVDLTKVSDGGFGIVSSVDDTTTITLTSGHTLPSSFKARVCDISEGAELYDNIDASVSGDILTLPDTTDIAAGDLIYALNRCEFTIGNSDRNISLTANSKLKFVEAGMDTLGRTIHKWSGVFRWTRLVANLHSYTPLSDTNKRLIVGWNRNDTNWTGGGIARNAGGEVRTSNELLNKSLGINGSLISGTQSLITLYFKTFISATTIRHEGNGSFLQSTFAGVTADINAQDYSDAVIYLCADDGAIFSSISL
jgi:hypothetical protein